MSQIANFLNGFGIRFGVAGSASVTLSQTNSECRRIHPSLIGYKPFNSYRYQKLSSRRAPVDDQILIFLPLRLTDSFPRDSPSLQRRSSNHPSQQQRYATIAQALPKVRPKSHTRRVLCAWTAQDLAHMAPFVSDFGGSFGSAESRLVVVNFPKDLSTRQR
jgi:hypothetical protein